MALIVFEGQIRFEVNKFFFVLFTPRMHVWLFDSFLNVQTTEMAVQYSTLSLRKNVPFIKIDFTHFFTTTDGASRTESIEMVAYLDTHLPMWTNTRYTVLNELV